ncbi:MAG: carboxypeptidase regulatory-like domain-containing protein [Methanobacteriota archaeon]
MQSDLSTDTHTGQTHDQSGQPEARQAKAERKEPSSIAASQSSAGAKLPRKDFRHHAGKAVSYVRGTWFGRNWYTITVLFFLVVLGLFVRSYFGVQPATQDGFLLSGGSDSYYHQHAYLYGYETGHHLHLEDMLNYPMGTRNPRPPLYDWSIFIGGEALSPFFGGDAIESMWWVFIFSTAFWGAITVIPTYFLAKEAFGKKAGYVAAFMIAIMPGHIQRSVLTNADHDAIALFFIVTAFYFFLKALKNLKADVYVDSWRDLKGAAGGLRRMVSENQVSALFALLSGFSFLAVALTWQGYAYMLVIVTLYFAIQILVNRFRNVDSMGVIMVYGISVGIITLLAFPYYYLSVQIASWYDAPTYMFLGALAFGMTLQITRKYPWLLVLSILTIGGVVAVLSLYLFWDSMYHTLIGAIASGAGYFVRNKQYETIAEAQAPPFSNLAMSFGVMTFWLSLVGIGYAIYQLPKKLKFDYIFIVVWATTSIYMAVSAARFMFNAAPAFAVTAGWIIAIIIAKLDLRGALEQQRRNASGFSNDWTVFQTSFAVGVIIGISGFGAYLYMDSLAPLAIAAVALMTLAYSVYAYGMRAKWYFFALGLLPMVITLALYATAYDGFHKTADHLAIPLITAFALVILIVQLRGAKLRTTAGVLFLAFLVVLPNVWGGVDAGIPYEVKSDYDKNIYDAIPSAFTPDSYDAQNGTNWYLGGFGYSLPLNTRYYPAAYDWLATQDDGIYPVANRPAYLSWWDYGFEAVNEGQHPTVADNFLGGHQLAGNFIMAQNESNAVALMTIRMIEADWARNRNSIKWGDPSIEGFFSPELLNVFESHGLDPDIFANMIKNPSEYVDYIKAHPEIYSPRDSVIQDVNALYLAAMGYISMSRNTDGVVSLYHDVSEATGWSIRYFAIDSRLFPFSGDNTGIFYAPAKLSDHRIKEPNQPYDFFEIKAVGEYGGEYSLEEIPDDVRVVDYKLQYNDMFYKTMLYKCFVGYSGADIGGTNADGIPGLNGTLESNEPMQGWNMTHFRRVYRTAYYNPYPSEEVRNHSDAWRAMNFDEAAKLQQDIQAGKATGVVDGSARSSMYQGVTFLKYYDGAIVSGRVALPDGTPLPGAHVTVYDEYGIPHNIVTTDQDGKYQLIAPFGNVSVVVSTGALTMDKLVGTELNGTQFFVRDDQAMRENVDQDANGVWDYYITKDIQVNGGNLTGVVFADADSDSTYSPNDYYLRGALVTATPVSSGEAATAIVAENGTYTFSSLPPGSYRVNISLFGYELVNQTTVDVGGTASGTQDFPVKTALISGYVLQYNQAPAVNATVAISDELTNIVDIIDTEESGYYNTSLIPGRYYIMSNTKGGDWSQTRTIEVKGSFNMSVNITVYHSVLISGIVKAGSAPAANVSVSLFNLRQQNQDISILTDSSGRFSQYIPYGDYMAYASFRTADGRGYAYLKKLLVDGNLNNLTLEMSRSGRIYGMAKDRSGIPAQNAKLSFHGEGLYRATTNSTGGYSVLLPAGNYAVHMELATMDGISLTSVNVPAGGTAHHDMTGRAGLQVSGTVFKDLDGDGLAGQNESLPFSKVTFYAASESGISLPFYTDDAGAFSGIVPSSETYIIVSESAGYTAVMYGPLDKKTAQATQSFPMDKGAVRVSGMVTDLSSEAPLGGQTIRFQPQYGSEIFVPVLADGTYYIDLAPGLVDASINWDVSGDGSMDEVYQFAMETVRLDVGVGMAGIEIDFQAVKRVRVNISATSLGNNISADVEFIGPEEYQYSIQNPEGEDVYLMPGEYAMVARYTPESAGNVTLDERMAFLNQTLSKGTNITFNLSATISLKGTVRYSGTAKPGMNITLTDVETGVAIWGNSSETGQYEIRTLPSRVYKLAVNQSMNEPSSLALRQYLYVAEQTVNMSASGILVINLDLVRSMDNATVAGALDSRGYGSQRLDFISADNSAIDAKATVGEDGRFSIGLAPGEYFLYAYDSAEKKVALQKLNVTTEGVSNLTISMVGGLKLSGNLYFRDSTPVETNVTILVGGQSKLSVYSSAGYYEIWLPTGSYNISAQRNVTEFSTDVLYTYNATVALSSNLRYNIQLARQDRYGARIDWNPAQNVPVAPGANQTYSFTLTNTGNLVDTYVMDVLGDDGWILSVSMKEVTLVPGASASMLLNMTIPEKVKVEHVPMTVTAESKGNPAGAAVSKEMEVNTTQRHEVSFTPTAIPPVEKADGYSFAISITNSGNGKDIYDVSVANIEDLAEKGWGIDWNASAAVAENANGTVLKGVSVDSNASVELRFTLVRNVTSAVPPSEVILYVRSIAEPNAFATYIVDVRSGVAVEGASVPSASGDVVADINPATGHLTDAIGAFSAVGIILVTYYYMRRRRWLS